MSTTTRQQIRVLFFTWNWALARFHQVCLDLAGEGHEIVIAIARSHKPKLPKPLRASPRIRLVEYDEVADPAVERTRALLRDARSYAWYLRPEHRYATFNRRESLKYLCESATGGLNAPDPAWPDPIVSPGPGELDALEASLAALEQRIPPDQGVLELIEAENPDVVLVSPLVDQRCHQEESLKAARLLGIPSGFLPRSWDNLTNKGRIHVPPDRTFVWNEIQRREAIELHGLDPASVVVTGAPHWDPFFSFSPSLRRESFCREHGFDPAAPIVVFLGSSRVVAADERLILGPWLEAVRQAPAPLRDANVLYRPHPDRDDPQLPANAAGRVSVNRTPKEADQRLYDELYHAAAAVGVNTTAQIEASIVGRPVYTFYTDIEIAPGQQGTLHFYYLLEQEGGPISHTESLEEHVAELTRGVTGDFDAEAIRTFAESFIRPLGIDRAVSPIVAAEIVALAGLRRARPTSSEAALTR